jgi:hypothetical protein
MGYGIKFLSTTQLRQIIDEATDPVVKAFAEATLSTYEIHLSLEKMLVESLKKENN